MLTERAKGFRLGMTPAGAVRSAPTRNLTGMSEPDCPLTTHTQGLQLFKRLRELDPYTERDLYYHRRRVNKCVCVRANELLETLIAWYTRRRLISCLNPRLTRTPAVGGTLRRSERMLKSKRKGAAKRTCKDRAFVRAISPQNHTHLTIRLVFDPTQTQEPSTALSRAQRIPMHL